MLVGYAGNDAEVHEFLAANGKRIEVPDAVLRHGNAGKFIEKKVREKIAQAAAVKAQDAADQQLLAARMDEQRAAEIEAKRAEKAAAEKQQQEQLKEQFQGHLDRVASNSLQAAAAIQSKEHVITQACDESLAQIQEIKNQALSAIAESRDEVIHLVNQAQKSEGNNSLAIFEINKRLQALEGKQNQ